MDSFSLTSFIVSIVIVVYTVANVVYINQVRQLVDDGEINVSSTAATFFFGLTLTVAVLAVCYMIFSVYVYHKERRDLKEFMGRKWSSGY